MLFHHLAAPASGVDIEQIVVEYPEPVDAEALEAAWALEVRREPALRMRFLWKDTDEPLQEVHSSAPLEFMISDWRAEPAPARRFEQHLREDRRRGFDLSEPPLLRLALFRLGDEHYRLLWTFHHIIIDGRSFVSVLQAVDAIYERVRRGIHVDEETADIGPYRDFIEGLQKQNREGARAFWREYLKDFSAPTPLPIDLEGGEGGPDRYGEQERCLSADASDRLRQLAEGTGVTLNTVFMGAWAILLGRYSGESDIVFGATKTGRRGSSGLGLYLNTIPVRVRADRQRRVSELLKDVRRTWVDLRQFEYTPLIEIKDCSQVPRSSPLFDSLVVFENQRFHTVLAQSDEKWRVRKCRLLEQTNYALSLLAYGNREIFLKLEYDASRYTAPAIGRMLGHIERILEAMAGSPDITLGAFEILSADEHQTIVHEWNRTGSEWARSVLVPDAIARAAAAAPDKAAAFFGEECIAYARLNRRASQLARYLRRRGIGPGALVGVHVGRSIDMLVALVGALKSGAAYVPLDPGFPPERLRFMAADAGLRALITQKSGTTDWAPEAARIEIDSDWPVISAEQGDEFQCPASPDSLAYVLYTSGSTGKPKGVQITHGALANFEYSMAREPGFQAADVLLAVTTISFDISGLELYLPLMMGMTVVIAPKEAAADVRALADLIRARQITVLQATPATWQMLLESGWEGDSRLKALCGGEALSRDLALRLLDVVGSLWNMYGPTETTIWSLVRLLTPADRTILIGRPIANTTVYILDEDGNPVPVGVAGELHIGGEGVALGYWNRPELTRERFIPDPFRPGAGTIYKTGDLARYWPRGEVECLGRNDSQVKIRGFRIELGEIEAVLREHPAVRQSVVVAREDGLGKRLVGYLVPQEEGRLSTADLRAFLASRLPDYMVPNRFVTLTAFPLTPNGKVNRLALPAPDPALSGGGEVYADPRDDFEREVCRMWADVLRLDRVGIRDNFFDLGGHSLLAVQLILRAHRMFPGEQIPLSVLLEAPTVELFAARLRCRCDSKWQYLVRMRQGDTTGRPPFFCVHGAGGNVLSTRPLAVSLPDDLPFYSLQAKGLDGSTPFDSVEETARCYIDEIRTVQPHGPYYVGGWCYGGVVAFEMARILEEMGESVAALVLIDTYNFAFGKFLPAHELLLRNVGFYFRRAGGHIRSLLSTPPGHWPSYIAGRLRTLRRHTEQLVGILRGRMATQFPDDSALGIGGASGTALGKALERVHLASMAAARNFVPKPFGGRAIVFRASLRRVEPYEDGNLGWGPCVRGGVEAFEIAGDHESIFEEPGVRAVAAIINAKLLEAAGSRKV